MMPDEFDVRKGASSSSLKAPPREWGTLCSVSLLLGKEDIRCTKSQNAKFLEADTHLFADIWLLLSTAVDQI